MGELFCSLTGINLTFVPYKGAAQALTELLAGQTQMTMLSTTVIVPPILAGKLRALAVTSTARRPEPADGPTLQESGFPNFPPGSWTGGVPPAGTPPGLAGNPNA